MFILRSLLRTSTFRRSRRPAQRRQPSQGVRRTSIQNRPLRLLLKPTRSVERPVMKSPIRAYVTQRVALAAGLGPIRKLRLMQYRLFGPDPNRTIYNKGLPLGRVLKVTAKGDVCLSRKLRTSALFATGIAGIRKHRSPGQGGSYRRTEDSKKPC